MDEYSHRPNPSPARDPPASLEMEVNASIERRNVNNNSSKYTTSGSDDREHRYSPVTDGRESAEDTSAPVDMSRRSPHVSEDAEDEMQQVTGESDASGESDNVIDGELSQQQRPSAGLLATRCSFTMLHEQSSD